MLLQGAAGRGVCGESDTSRPGRSDNRMPYRRNVQAVKYRFHRILPGLLRLEATPVMEVMVGIDPSGRKCVGCLSHPAPISTPIETDRLRHRPPPPAYVHSPLCSKYLPPRIHRRPHWQECTSSSQSEHLARTPRLPGPWATRVGPSPDDRRSRWPAGERTPNANIGP